MNFDAASKAVRTVWAIIGVIILTIIVFTAGSGWGWEQMASIGALTAGGIATTAITFGVTLSAMEKFGASASSSSSAKTKNDRKVRDLLSRLSEDELDLLRNTLSDERTGYGLADDGEIVQKRIRS